MSKTNELEAQAVVEIGILAAKACRLAGLPGGQIRELITEGLLEDAPPGAADDLAVKALLDLLAICLQRLDVQQDRIEKLEASNG